MVVVDCPYRGYQIQTNDVTDALVSTLLQIHAFGSHPSAANGDPGGTSNTPGTAQVEKVRHPTISTSGNSEE